MWIVCLKIQTLPHIGYVLDVSTGEKPYKGDRCARDILYRLTAS